MAGPVSVTGEVRREGDSYMTMVEGVPTGGPAGLDFALYRLTIHLRQRLPVVAPSTWQVTVEGERAGRFVVVFGEADLRFDADDVWRDSLWSIVQELPRSTLSEAIESAAALVRVCGADRNGSFDA